MYVVEYDGYVVEYVGYDACSVALDAQDGCDVGFDSVKATSSLPFQTYKVLE